MEDSKEKKLLDKLKRECWDDALHAYGTGYIYSLRAKRIRTGLQAISLLGIAVPGILGGIVFGYGLDSSVPTWTIVVATPLGILQLFLSICSVVYGWSDIYQFYLESYAENSSLASEYEQLVKFTDKDFDTLKIEKDKLDIKRNNRTKQDSKNSLSEKECRKGMRWSLRKYQRSCAACSKIPTSMDSTSCGVCGNFNLFNK